MPSKCFWGSKTPRNHLRNFQKIDFSNVWSNFLGFSRLPRTNLVWESASNKTDNTSRLSLASMVRYQGSFYTSREASERNSVHPRDNIRGSRSQPPIGFRQNPPGFRESITVHVKLVTHFFHFLLHFCGNELWPAQGRYLNGNFEHHETLKSRLHKIEDLTKKSESLTSRVW